MASNADGTSAFLSFSLTDGTVEGNAANVEPNLSITGLRFPDSNLRAASWRWGKVAPAPGQQTEASPYPRSWLSRLEADRQRQRGR